MSEKKHKGGYELLKERYAALQAEHDELQKDLDFALEKVKKERDEWKAKWQQANAAKQDAVDRYNRKQIDFVTVSKAHNILSERNLILEERICWLLKHASWFTLWMYRKQFEKGGKE